MFTVTVLYNASKEWCSCTVVLWYENGFVGDKDCNDSAGCSFESTLLNACSWISSLLTWWGHDGTEEVNVAGDMQLAIVAKQLQAEVETIKTELSTLRGAALNRAPPPPESASWVQRFSQGWSPRLRWFIPTTRLVHYLLQSIGMLTPACGRTSCH